MVTDVHMPGNTDGFALIAWLRQEVPHVKVIVISGRAVTADVADAGYSKPFDMSALVHRVRCLLSGTPGQS